MSAYLHVSESAAAADIRFRNAWMSSDGDPRACVEIGRADLILASPDEADALMAAAAKAKAELIRLEAERQAAQGGEH